MAVSLAPTDWHFPNSSSAPMDHQAKQNVSSSASSSSKSVTTAATAPSTAPPARHDSSSNSDPRPSPNQHNDSPKGSPPMNGQFVPYGMPPQATWSPQQQPGFAYPGMYGYFPQQPGQFPAFDPQQQPNAQQFSQWAAYQQMLFNAQQQQQQQIAAAVAAGMMPARQRTGSSPQTPPPDFAQAFMANGQFPPNMMNNGAFSPMAFPNGPGASGTSSGRGSAASEPSTNNQAFHPYRRTKGSQSTSSAGSPASSTSPPSGPTIAGLPSSAFPPLQAAQPPYARERTNSNSSANSSRSSRSGAGGNRSHPNTRSPSAPPPPGPQHRSSSSTSGSNGRTTPSQGRASDASATRPSATRTGSSSSSNHPPAPGPPRTRTPSNSSASSSPSSPSTAAPAVPAAGSTQNSTGSVRSRAPPKPSPLSQQPSISAELTPSTIASKRLSRDDSELRAYGETVHAHTPRSAGLKGRLRRALSLSPSGALTEDERPDPATPKLGSRKQVVAAKNNAEQARAAAAAAANEKKAAPAPLPLSPTTPTSAHSGSTIGAGGSSLTPPGSTGDVHDDNVSDAPPDPSIRSTKKKNKAGSLFNRKWNASTDNISLSSTVSSASLMIRKIGSVGALARRKSLTGITSLFKDKDKDKNKEKGEKADKKGKAGASTAGISQIHAEFDRGDLGASGSDDMVGLSPAAKLARQHTLRSNAEAAARAKQQELLRQQQEQQQHLRHTGGNSMSGRHMRNISEDGSEDGFTHITYSGQAGGEQQAYYDDEDEGEGEELDDGDVTVRHESLDLEVEPWAQNVRRSLERTRVPTRGILKGAGTYKQEEDLKLSRTHSLTRSRANSYDTLTLKHRSNEPGPLARIPSADPDHIDGLQSTPQSGSDTDGLLPPLNLTDISNFTDSPTSSTTTLHTNSTGNVEKPGAGSVYMHPNMNSSAPTLTLMGKNDENSLSQRSQTTPAPSSKRITFAANLSVYDTFSPNSYDRRSEPATCNHLTPALAQRIKEELNSFKMEEMEVHYASRAHTQFFV